eukprot:jgi/Bigna1/71452/fgenesh1_pg.15_\
MRSQGSAGHLFAVAVLMNVLFVAVEGGLFDGNPYITNMDENNFPSAMGNSSTWLVNFYSPWCPHCVNFAPKWKQMAVQCATTDGIRIGAIDCVQNKKVCRAQQIKGFPTVKEFKNGNQGNLSGYSEAKGKDMPRGEKLVKEINVRCPHPHAAGGGRGAELEASMHRLRPQQHPTTPREIEVAENNARGNSHVEIGTTSKTEKSAKTTKNQVNLPRQYPLSAGRNTMDNRVRDALAALVYSFQEVIFATRSELSAQEVHGLKEFLGVVSKALPLHSHREAFLELARRYEVLLSRDISTIACEREWNDWKKDQGRFILEEISPIYQLTGTPSYDTCRGYTCALWRERMCFNGIHSFVTYFFSCDVCRSHFNKMYPRSSTSEHFSSRHPSGLPEIYHNKVALWIWHAHNRVNMRLATEEQQQQHNDDHDDIGTADNNRMMTMEIASRSAAAMWPSISRCRQCRSSSTTGDDVAATIVDLQAMTPHHNDQVALNSVKWRQPVVLAFLHEYYCHPNDVDACGQLLLPGKGEGRLAILTSIVFAAKIFLIIVFLAVVAVACRQRHRLALTFRWAYLWVTRKCDDSLKSRKNDKQSNRSSLWCATPSM